MWFVDVVRLVWLWAGSQGLLPLPGFPGRHFVCLLWCVVYGCVSPVVSLVLVFPGSPGTNLHILLSCLSLSSVLEIDFFVCLFFARGEHRECSFLHQLFSGAPSVVLLSGCFVAYFGSWHRWFWGVVDVPGLKWFSLDLRGSGYVSSGSGLGLGLCVCSQGRVDARSDRHIGGAPPGAQPGWIPPLLMGGPPLWPLHPGILSLRPDGVGRRWVVRDLRQGIFLALKGIFNQF